MPMLDFVKGVSRTISVGERAVTKTIGKGESLITGKPVKVDRTMSNGSSNSNGMGGSSRRMVNMVARTVSTGTARVGRLATGANAPKRQAGTSHSDEEHMFCSDMYSIKYITESIQKVRKNGKITKLVLEDLILRDDEEATAAVVDMIIRCHNCKHNKANRDNVLRLWESITFVDCVSDESAYEAYEALLQDFLDKINQKMKKKDSETRLPIRSELKVELHSMLDGDSVLRLLRAIERDRNVKALKFPGFRGKDDEIVDAVCSSFDRNEMRLTQNMEIFIRFNKNSGTSKLPGDNPKTAIIRLLTKKLERMIFAASGGGLGSLGDDLSEELDDGEKPREESYTESSAFDSQEELPVQVRKLQQVA